MLKRLELSQDDHRTLKSKCDELRIEFLSTPFDLASAEFLTSDLDVSRLKVGSGELTNAPFLLAIARLGVPIILSTGMSDFTEIEQALRILAYGLTGAGGVPEIAAELDGNSLGHLRESVTLLHCTSEYPAPIEDVNLARSAGDDGTVFSARRALGPHAGPRCGRSAQWLWAQR